jgi:hypothetical protein
VNLLNPHGFHYTLEGPRKRDWPPSMFYQYPWWHFYDEFSTYVARLSQMLTGGRHVANVAVLWPINDIFATYTPQHRNAFANRTERDFDTLTDMLLRLHRDFDYLDEDFLADAEVDGGTIRLREEAYSLVILPPMRHLKLSTLDALERFVAGGGKVLGMVFLPDTGFGDGELVDIRDRVKALFGVDPAETQETFTSASAMDIPVVEHDGGGTVAFLKSYALNRSLPRRLQEQLGMPGEPEGDDLVIEEEGGVTSYWHVGPDGERQDVTGEVRKEREEMMQALGQVINGLITPDILIDNPEVFYLHRIKDDRDLYFLVNPTYQPQHATVTLPVECRPVLWDTSTGEERPVTPYVAGEGSTMFEITLAPTGSAFIVLADAVPAGIDATDAVVTEVTGREVRGYLTGTAGCIRFGAEGTTSHAIGTTREPVSIAMDGEWTFRAEDENALIIDRWLGSQGPMDVTKALDTTSEDGWFPMVPGAWAYQLPSEPAHPYPVDVWYRATFEADALPPSLTLIVDGFAGSVWRVYVNGEQITDKPRRSRVDSQMQAVDITSVVRTGENTIAINMTATGPTDGLLDLLKITGDFALIGDGRRIGEVPASFKPESWTTQGYPYYAGRGVYRTTVTVPNDVDGYRAILHPEMVDDVLEVVVNGERAGVRLWAPYEIDLTDVLQPGENTIELRVANTLINLLEAVERPSGLAGTPRITFHQPFEIDLPAGDGA